MREWGLQSNIMKYIDYFKMALQNLNRRKFRTIINVFSISIGVMLIITLTSLGSGFQTYLISKITEFNDLNHISVYATKYQSKDDLRKKLATTDKDGNVDIKDVFEKKKIDDKFLNEFKENPKIEGMLTKYENDLSEVSYEDKKVKNIKASSYVGDYFLKSELSSLKEKVAKEKSKNKSTVNDNLNYIIEGELLKEGDKDSVMLPELFVRTSLGVEDVSSIIGKEISISSIIPNYDEDKVFDKKLKVVGVINQQYYQPNLIVSNDVMADLKNFQDGKDIELADRGFDVVELSVKDVKDVNSIVNQIEQKDGYRTESIEAVASTMNKILVGIKGALSVLGIVVILIASLDVINTMIMSIHERTKMIGLMKAVGGSKKDIRNIFLMESGTIGLIGGVVGTALSYVTIIGLRELLAIILGYLDIKEVSFLTDIVTMDMKIAVYTIIFSIILTMLAGLYPSFKASKLSPVQALRHD